MHVACRRGERTEEIHITFTNADNNNNRSNIGKKISTTKEMAIAGQANFSSIHSYFKLHARTHKNHPGLYNPFFFVFCTVDISVFFFNSVGGKSFIFIALLFAPLLCTISHSARLCSFFDVLFVVVISCARVYIYYNSRNIFIQFLFFAYFFLSRFRRLLFSMRLCCWWFFFNLFVPLL